MEYTTLLTQQLNSPWRAVVLGLPVSEGAQTL